MKTPARANIIPGSRTSATDSAHGNVSVMVLVMMFVFITAALGVVSMTQVSYRKTVVEGQRNQAEQLADAGVEHVIWRLQQTPTWFNISDEQDIAVGPGTYYLTQLNGAAGAITSFRMQGWVPNRSAAGAQMSEVNVELNPVSPFRFAAFGNQSVSILGQTNSYNSSTDPTASFMLSHGNSGTNSTNTAAVSVGTLTGIGYYPPYGTPSVVSGSPTGGIQMSPTDNRWMFLNPPVPPATAIPILPYSGGDWTRADTGQIIAQPLTGGTYYVQGDISLSGNSTLSINGPVTIYVQGNISVSGNAILNNISQLPPNLILYGTATTTSIAISGNGNFYGAIFAPNASITHNGSGSSGGMYGAAVGKTVTGNGNHADYFYDEALANVGLTRFRIQNWTLLK